MKICIIIISSNPKGKDEMNAKANNNLESSSFWSWKRDGGHKRQEEWSRTLSPVLPPAALFVKSATKLHLRYRNVVIEITPKRTISSSNPIRDYFLSHHGFGFVLKSQKEIKNINSFRKKKKKISIHTRYI